MVAGDAKAWGGRVGRANKEGAIGSVSGTYQYDTSTCYYFLPLRLLSYIVCYNQYNT